MSLNVPMSNIVEEDQTIKEDACHRLTPAKGLRASCAENACFVGLARHGAYGTCTEVGMIRYFLCHTSCEPAVMPTGSDFIPSLDSSSECSAGRGNQGSDI